MNASKDAKVKGIAGYITLIFSASFIDVPIIALLAMPGLIAGPILLIMSILSLTKVDNGKESVPGFSTVLVVIGIVALSVTMGFTGVKFIGYDVISGSHNVADRFYPASLKIVYIILIADFIATSVIVWGIKLRSGIKGKEILFVWVILFLSIPLIVAIIKLLQFILFQHST